MLLSTAAAAAAAALLLCVPHARHGAGTLPAPTSLQQERVVGDGLVHVMASVPSVIQLVYWRGGLTGAHARCQLSYCRASGHLRKKRGGNEPHVTQDVPACARTALGSRDDALMPAVLSERMRQRGSPALTLATGHRLEQQQLALLVAASSSAAVESAPCSGRSYSF